MLNQDHSPLNQVKFLEDEKDACSERQIRRLISLGETSSRRASLPNNLPFLVEASDWASNHSPGHGLRLNTFGNDSKGAQLCSDANHTPQQEKKEPKQKSPSGAQASGKSTKRPAESSSVPHKKSRRAKSHNDLEEPDGDDGSGDDKKEEKFACPFYRKDPLRFLECMNVRLVSIPIVKQHLKRRHAANPDPDGSGCQEDHAFSTVSGDYKTEANCAQGNTEDLDIIPPKVLDALKRRSDRRMSSTDQWHDIYVLLFGESHITPKPLLDGVVKEMTSIIRDIWSKDGGQILNKHILTRGMPVSSDQLLLLLPDLLDSVDKRFEDKPVGANADKQIAGTQEPAVKMTTKEICICHQGSVNTFQTPYYMPEMSRYTAISPSASFTRHPPTPVFGVEEDAEDAFGIPHYMPHLSIYNPISASASVTRYSPTPIFEAGNSDDPFQNTYQSHLSYYTPISTSPSLTGDSRTPTFDVENSDALRSVGGVFESQDIPYAYPPTTSSVYPEPINFRGMTDSECDPYGTGGN
ncbi:hypothetical protein FMUND_9466 [Fusarium mundagurra]|uniref:Uncharacterized protein n=1 Tax=Fusarium mundagurra TaxID=1567541 RepID=A0A8H5YFQ8_9HYPO|nr:hypothetical protein FMUND_9466 [Fusarium mundagurra]